MHTLPIIVDRAQSVLAAKGVRAKRQVILEAVTAALGFRNSNEAVAASKAGVLDLRDALPIRAATAGGVALAILRDPVADKAFGIEQASLPARATRGADAIATSPYGNLLALPAAEDVQGAGIDRVVTAEVTVEATVPSDQLHEYDREVAGTYVYQFGTDDVGPVEDERLDPIEEHALTLFHDDVAIKVLDHFQITVAYRQPARSHHERKPANSKAAARTISVIVTAEERDAPNPIDDADRDVAGTYLYTFDPADAAPTDDPELDPIKEHALKLFHSRVQIQDVDAFEYKVVVPNDAYQDEFGDWRRRNGFDEDDTKQPAKASGGIAAWCGYASTPKDGKLIHATDRAAYRAQVAAWCRENAGYMSDDGDPLADGMTDDQVIAAFFEDRSASGSCWLEDVEIPMPAPAPASRPQPTAPKATDNVVIYYAHVSSPDGNAHFCSPSWEEYQRELATWCMDNSHLMGEDEDALDAGWADERIIRTFFEGPQAATNCFLDQDSLVLGADLGKPVLTEAQQTGIRRLAERMERLHKLKAGDKDKGLQPLSVMDEPMVDVLTDLDFGQEATLLRSLLGGKTPKVAMEDHPLSIWDHRLGTDEEDELSAEQRKTWMVSARQTGETVTVKAYDPNRKHDDEDNRTFSIVIEMDKGRPFLFLANGARNEDVPLQIHMREDEVLVEGHSNQVARFDDENHLSLVGMDHAYPAMRKLARTKTAAGKPTADADRDPNRIMATVEFVDQGDGQTPTDQRIEVTDRFLDLDFAAVRHLANGTRPANSFPHLEEMHRISGDALGHRVADFSIEPADVVAFLVRHGFLPNEKTAVGSPGYGEMTYRTWQQRAADDIAAIRERLAQADRAQRLHDVVQRLRGLSEEELQHAVRLSTETWRDAGRCHDEARIDARRTEQGADGSEPEFVESYELEADVPEWMTVTRAYLQDGSQDPAAPFHLWRVDGREPVLERTFPAGTDLRDIEEAAHATKRH